MNSSNALGGTDVLIVKAKCVLLFSSLNSCLHLDNGLTSVQWRIMDFLVIL